MLESLLYDSSIKEVLSNFLKQIVLQFSLQGTNWKRTFNVSSRHFMTCKIYSCTQSSFVHQRHFSQVGK